MFEKDVEQVAEFLHRVVQISLVAQKEAGSKKLVDFVKAYESGTGETPKLVKELKEDVLKFATSFPLPGVPDTVSWLCWYPARGYRLSADIIDHYQAFRLSV